MNKNFKFLFFLTALLLSLCSAQSVLAANISCREICKEEYASIDFNYFECVEDREGLANEDWCKFPRIEGENDTKCDYSCRIAKSYKGKTSLDLYPTTSYNSQDKCDIESQVCACFVRSTRIKDSKKNCIQDKGWESCEALSSNSCANNEKCCVSYDQRTYVCGSNNFCSYAHKLGLGYGDSIGSRCVNDETCQSMSCVDGSCSGISKRGGVCERDDFVCEGNLTCDSSLSPNICLVATPSIDEGSACYSNKECKSRKCEYDQNYFIKEYGPIFSKYYTVPETKICVGDDGDQDPVDLDPADPVSGSNSLGEFCFENQECESKRCIRYTNGTETLDVDMGSGAPSLKCAGTIRNNYEGCGGDMVCNTGHYCTASEADGERRCRSIIDVWVAPTSGTCEYFCEYGGDMPDDKVCVCNPLKVDSFEEIIENISNFIFNIALVLAPLAIVWAGGMYITSSGNPTKIEEARRIIQYALIGLIIIMLSKGLIAVFYNFLQE